MNYSFDEEAHKEMMAAAQYYDDERSGLGELFLDAVRNAVNEIVQDPGCGTQYEVVRARTILRRTVKRYSYVVVYEVIDVEIVIWAVVHTSRRPGYWLRRRSFRK